MNAPERVRNYLQTRIAYYREINESLPASIATTHDWETGKNVPLREADLEVLLQMQDMLAALLSAAVSKTSSEAMPASDFIEWAHARATNPHLPPGYSGRLQEHEDRT